MCIDMIRRYNRSIVDIKLYQRTVSNGILVAVSSADHHLTDGGDVSVGKSRMCATLPLAGFEMLTRALREAVHWIATRMSEGISEMER